MTQTGKKQSAMQQAWMQLHSALRPGVWSAGWDGMEGGGGGDNVQTVGNGPVGRGQTANARALLRRNGERQRQWLSTFR